MFRTVLVAATLAAGALAADLTVNTPGSLVECQPVLLSWTGGVAPYYISVIPGGDASGAALKDFGQQSSTQLTWTVDIASGTSVTVKVVDSTGATNYDSQQTIQAGSSTSCLNASASASGSETAAAAADSTDSAAAATDASASASAAGTEAASTAAGTASAAAGTTSVGAAASSAKVSSTSASGSASKVASASGSAAASATTTASSATRFVASTGVVALVGALTFALF